MSSEVTKGQKPDVYGQLHPVETPDLVDRKLKELEHEIGQLSVDDKKNLLLAEQSCPKLVTDDFKLLFLRCEVFNADLAAHRYASYWNKRVEIFGPNRAFKPLTLEYFEDDWTALATGLVNVIERECDRNFFFSDPSKQDRTAYTRESMMRAFWYFLHALLEDEEVQKKGLLVINYPHRAKLSQVDKPLFMQMIASIRGKQRQPSLSKKSSQNCLPCS
jgi:hypothetical protein